MIAPDGRVLHNLDEFMLRLGHLTVACKAAAEFGGSTYRLTEELSQRLTNQVVVPADVESSVSSYLKAKGLCADASKTQSTRASVRYPDIVIEQNGQDLQLHSTIEREPTIWWQDLMLADAKVRSRVGGITVSAKSGSKSGLSHILDWASLLDLITPTGDLTADGRLIANVATQANPYVLTAERIVYGWRYLQADFDLAARLLRRCSENRGTLKRKDATSIFVQSLEQLLEEAAESKRLSNRQYDAIYSAYSELERSAGKAGKSIPDTSTAWHRASSRYESLVDLGFLEKAGAEGKYAYLYRCSEAQIAATATFDAQQSVEDWFEHHFLNCMLPECETGDVELSDELLLRALDLLGSGSNLVAIDTLILALSICFAEQRKVASVAAWRAELVKLTRERPELARLSAGRYGSRAEFVSIRKRKLGEA
jgi:hypothetical protein